PGPEDEAAGGVLPEEPDRDRVEAVARGEAVEHAVEDARDLDHPRKPGETARDRHREHDARTGIDARLGRRARAEADRTQLVAEGRPTEEAPEDHDRGDREEDPGVK